MKRAKERLFQIAMLGVLGLAFTFSFGQLTVTANEAPCEGLQCTEQQDCGKKCFCNRPAGGCFLN